MDTVSKETRSRMMSSVRSKNTKLELEIRHRLFADGFRFRLHRRDLPGTPDLVFPKYSVAIFIHGCFWHYHGCHLSKIPDTRTTWWRNKLEENLYRDAEAIRKLKALGWRLLVIWECSFRRPGIVRAEALDRIACRAEQFLFSRRKMLEIPFSGNRNKLR